MNLIPIKTTHHAPIARVIPRVIIRVFAAWDSQHFQINFPLQWGNHSNCNNHSNRFEREELTNSNYIIINASSRRPYCFPNTTRSCRFTLFRFQQCSNAPLDFEAAVLWLFSLTILCTLRLYIHSTSSEERSYLLVVVRLRLICAWTHTTVEALK